MIAEFESRILALIDDMVEHASDDELFASGYLRGHLTLAMPSWRAVMTTPLRRSMPTLAKVWKKRSAPANCRRAIRR